MKPFDKIYRKYTRNKNIVDRYEKYHAPLPRLPHSCQAYNNLHREEVHQDNESYSINIIQQNKDRIKPCKEFKDIYIF